MIDLTTYALLRKQIATAASGVSDVRAEGDELVFVLADGREVRVAVPATGIRDAEVRDGALVLTLADGQELVYTPTTTVVDATLTQSGQAADAKVTGDAVSQLKNDMTAKADKAALTRTDRSLDALWKLNQGISYDFQTDAEEAYQKTVLSGAKLADIQSIGGHTEVINEELVSADVESVIERGRNICSPIYNRGVYNNRYVLGIIKVKKNTQYYITASEYTTIPLFGVNAYTKEQYTDNPTADYIWGNGAQIAGNTATFNSGNYEYIGFRVWRANEECGLTENTKFCLSEVNEYSSYRENTYDIPASVRALPGYGWSAGSVHNSIERTETGWQYVQRVGKYVFDGTENWKAKDVGYCYFTNKHFDNGLKKDVANFLTNVEGEYRTIRVRSDGNGLIARYSDSSAKLTLDEIKSRFSSGKILHYEYETPIITDITDLMADFPAYFEVEAGGTITIENTAMLPVPSTEKYLIALAEVNG